MSEGINIVRAPTFSGDAEDWPFFKAKIRAFLAKNKLSKILTWKEDIPKDDHVWAQGYDATKKKEEQLIQQQNIMATGILLQSIDTDTPGGKAAFYQVEKTIDADGGYAGGNFLMAWNALCKRYDEKEVVTSSLRSLAYRSTTLDLIDMG